jgi:uncharacterized protein (TIGR02117 family)
MVPRYLDCVASFWSNNNTRAILLIALLACACAGPIAQPHFRGEGEKAKRIFVVSHGWHSGIVIRKADIAENALPEVRHFPDADYLEVGWGDWDYYQAPDPGLGLALKAAFWPSRSVLRVAGFKEAVESYFRGSEIVEIGLSDEAFQRLIQFISDTFSRPDPTVSVEARPGVAPDSRFYAAKGKFHIFRNCNTWVAEALQFAGLPITPGYAFTAGNLISQVKRLSAPS